MIFHKKIMIIGWALLSLSVAQQPVITQDANDRIPTMSYDRPLPLLANGQAIQLGAHAAPRCYDWDLDGDQDLLVGGGDGRLWLYLNQGQPDNPIFEGPKVIVAGSRSRWGKSYTGVVFSNLLGDDSPDLAVCHSGDLVTIHQNIGSAKQPRFLESGPEFRVQKSCQGRFDIADWDADGLGDLITGSFGGKLIWYRNQGKPGTPKFNNGSPFFDLGLAYNSHPRLLDFNRDGKLDLLLGVNWGTVSLYLNRPTGIAGPLSSPRLFQWSTGKTLNIRENNGDDTTPEIADLDGDGVLDLISGGKNGQLFFMKGVGFPTRVATLASLFKKHAHNLGRILLEDTEIRQQIFGTLASIQSDLASGLIPSSAREPLFRQLSTLARQHPFLLGRSQFNLASDPHLPILAGQYWVVLLESLPDSKENRQRVADTLGFTKGHRKLLVDLGVILIDNNQATPQHLAAMHRLMTTIPKGVWDVETITVAGWLGPASKTQKIRSRSGVNIFDLPLGRQENSFANDSPRPGFTDVFLICLAHELAHNMLDTVGRSHRPDLYQRKFEGLAQAAGPHVVYKTPKTRGIDRKATQANFQKLGFWNGKDSDWQEAWINFFKGKEEFEKAYTRGNIQFFLDSPQEAFATLANQFFADSQLMLDFCKVRWDTGHTSNINQFLLIADYLSEKNNQVNFYVMRPGGDLTVFPVQLMRDAAGRITRVKSKSSTAHFQYNARNLVTGFELSPNHEP